MTAKKLALCLTALCGGLAMIETGCGGGSSSSKILSQLISVVVTPNSATVAANGTQSLTPTISGDSRGGGVNWKVSCSASACGTVAPASTTSGVATTYSAPAPASDLTVTVTATSLDDPTKSATATLTIPAITISVSPTSANVVLNGTQAFSGTLTNDPAGNGVSWTLLQNGTACSPTCGILNAGSSASGASVTYTAPPILPASAAVTVTGTSITDSTKSATCSLTIVLPPISVSVAPTSETVAVTKTANFAANAQYDAANKGVTWTLSQNGAACTSGCGSVAPGASNTTATYTAPATIPSNSAVTITATSVSDSSKSARATINVVATAPKPQPLLNQLLVPESTAPGSAAFTLKVNGTGFVSGSVVHWNGSARTTTFVNGSSLTAHVLATDIASPNTATVTVVSPIPGGGTSNGLFFSVTPSSSSLDFSASAVSTPPGPVAVATGDLNADGKLDIILGAPGSGTANVLLGNGDGTFQAPASYTVGTSASSGYAIATGDFNGDGKLDFAIADSADSYLSVFLGNGDGTFQAAVNYTVGLNPTAVAVADLNGDGKLDLAVSNQNCSTIIGCIPGTVSILLGNGDGTFQTHSDFDVGLDPNWVIAGDFNGDGKLDLAAVDGQGNAMTSAASILLGNGDGTFQAPVTYPLNTNAASGSTADLNGDGKLDLVIADNNGVVSILLGNGDGTFQPRVDYSVDSLPWGAVVIEDLNGDGKPDVAVADSGSNDVSVLLGNGDGTFQPQLTFPVGSQPQGVAVGDFRQNGRLDLAVSNTADSTVSILLQISTLTFTPAAVNITSQVVGTSTAVQPVTMTNNGPVWITISGVSLTGTNAADFSQANNCLVTLVASASCTINVVFTPSQVGPESATLTVSDDAAGNPQSVTLSGVGVVNGPNATSVPTSLTFATQVLGTTSAAQTVILTNYGTNALSLTGITISGDFAQTNNCPSTLATLASCTVNVTFSPTQIDARSGSLTIADNAPGSPQIIPLSGAGTVVQFNPASLSFGSVKPKTSAVKSTTLTNTGSVTLNISGIAITGDTTDFSETNTCAATVAAGQSCVITLTFEPLTSGAKSANLSATDDGGASPQLVPLTGRGETCFYYHGVLKCHSASVGNNPAVRAAVSQNRTIVAPAVSGKNPVGTRILHVVDSIRPDPFVSTGAPRELLLRVWYPSIAGQHCQIAPYTSPRVWRYFGELTGLSLPNVRTNSCLNAAVAPGAHPVVVFSPGYTATFTDHTFLFEDLASRGYVVVSVDHTYEATAIEFPDGRFIKSAVGSHLRGTWRLDDETMSLVLATRNADLKFVVDQLESMNANPGAFQNALDLDHIGVMGHSLGGESAISALQQDPRVKAGALLEGGITDESVIPTNAPVLMLGAGRPNWSQNECGLWNNIAAAHVAVNLNGGEHVTPTDLVWLAKFAINTGSMGPDRSVAAIRDYVAAFFDAHLRAKSPAPLLRGASRNYPDVMVVGEGQRLCKP
jgi:dienelactone hydrolase